MAKLKQKKLIRKIAPRLYASVADKDVKKTVRGNWAAIVSVLYPKALLSHATALTYQPSGAGEVFLTASNQREIVLPGLVLKFMRGPKPIESDVVFIGGMKASSFERALLENLSPARGSLSGRAVPAETIEKRLEDILRIQGEGALNAVRDRARGIAEALAMKAEFRLLDGMIGALLGTKSSKALKGAPARARATGEPYDPACVGRLEILFAHLRHRPFREIPEKKGSARHFANKAFFEAYFSNYIEGTIFEVREAERIVFDGTIPASRLADAHDVLGTFQVVSDPNQMKRVPRTPEDLENLLKGRHTQILAARPEVGPGEYKRTANRAGNTLFVHPADVRGTFKKAFDLYGSLPSGLARAIFIMFAVAEVHPFNDGNGRVARIMMNAELFSRGLATIIIPNVYRADYVSALRALSRREDPEPYTRMLAAAHEFSALDFTSYPEAKKLLEARNWFQEPNDAKLIRD